MSTTKRRFAMLLATTAIIAAACSGGGTSPAPSADASAPGSTAPSTAPESQAPAGLTGSVSLWHSYSSGAGTELDALNQVLDAVKAANPDLTVEVL